MINFVALCSGINLQVNKSQRVQGPLELWPGMTYVWVSKVHKWILDMNGLSGAVQCTEVRDSKALQRCVPQTSFNSHFLEQLQILFKTRCQLL